MPNTHCSLDLPMHWEQKTAYSQVCEGYDQVKNPCPTISLMWTQPMDEQDGNTSPVHLLDIFSSFSINLISL